MKTNQNPAIRQPALREQKWLFKQSRLFAALLLGLLVVVMTGCSLPQPTINAPFVGTVWEWTGTMGGAGDTLTIASPERYTIQFQSDGKYNGQADCNLISGTYAVNGSSLRVIPGATTLVGCPAGSLDSQYTNQLSAAASWLMQGTEFAINLKANAGTMRFRQQAAPGNASVLIGPVWKWRYTQTNAGTNQNVSDPNQYGLQFFADGKLQIQADCNQGSGVYTTGANNALTIQINQMTRAACPPGSLSDQYVQQLNSAVSYFTGGPDLVINIQNDTARMNFTTSENIALTPAPTTVAQVTVTPTAVPPTVAPTVVPPTAPPVCPGPPMIEFFVANPPTILRGQGTTLSWGQVTNATAVAIDQGIGGVSAPGSIMVAPHATTTYMMLATGCGGQSQALVTVNVIQPTVAPTQLPPTAVPTQPPPTAVPTQPPAPTNTPVPPPTVQPGADLIGLTWQWNGTTLNDGTRAAPSNPGQYTIVFSPNGTVSVQADCNQANGTYVVNGSSLTIVLTTRTTAICGPDSLSDQFLAWLQQAGSYQAQDVNLTILLKADSGNMTFTGTRG